MLRRVLKRDYPKVLSRVCVISHGAVVHSCFARLKVLFPSRYDYAACEACIKLRVARRRGIEMDSEVTSHQIMYRAERKGMLVLSSLEQCLANLLFCQTLTIARWTHATRHTCCI